MLEDWGSILVSCGKCKDREVLSCPLIRDHAYEINHTITFAMRLLGVGMAGLRQFCGIMDLPKPVAQSTYDTIVGYMLTAAKTVAKASMFSAANDEVTKTREKMVMILRE